MPVESLSRERPSAHEATLDDGSRADLTLIVLMVHFVRMVGEIVWPECKATV